MRRTKIIATLGPASSDPGVLSRMIRAGMDVARLNLSHGSRAAHARAIRTVRAEADRLGRHVGLLLDLQGPKLRVGAFAGGHVRLRPGDTVMLTNRPALGTPQRIPVVYARLLRDVHRGDRVLLDDGLVELRVTGRDPDALRCRVTIGGSVGDHKGISFPGATLSAAPLTSKDRADLRFGLEQGADFVALSFVRRAEDIAGLRRLLRGVARPPLVIAKIERRGAIERLDEILAAADGVMVARGDLGVEYPSESVPVLQKRIIELANECEVMVITATQMLESMVQAPRPTRAEASDVANAIFDGTDAVMLSGETAVGRFPERAVKTMARSAAEAEVFTGFARPARRRLGETSALASPTHALAHTARHAAREIGARALVVFSHTGFSARLVSKARPQARIMALTPLPATCRRLALAWGVTPVRVPRWRSAEGMIEQGMRILLERRMLRRGDWAVAMAGTTTQAGGTNLLRIVQIGRPPDRLPRRR